VSIVGAGMIGRPGVAAQMFQALADAGVNLQMISTSEIKVSCVIAAGDRDLALEALCRTFEVTSSNLETPGGKPAPSVALPPVRGVALDRQQAQLAIRAVPDRPGMAAQIFSLLAQNQISVDMIIQSQRYRPMGEQLTRDIACTVARGDAPQAKALLEAIAPELGCGAIDVNLAIAKVSVVGSGMMYQPGVAARLFQALADRQINIQMIATSEIKICCLVDEDRGVEALQTIHAAFNLGGTQTIAVSA